MVRLTFFPVRHHISLSNCLSIISPSRDSVFDRLTAKATDHDWLPNATARFKIGDDIQVRLGYAKSLRRPNFEALNPAITLNQSNNPLVQSSGNAGNPDLKAQKSQSLDATFEYYFGSGYIALAGYYRDITVFAAAWIANGIGFR